MSTNFRSARKEVSPGPGSYQPLLKTEIGSQSGRSAIFVSKREEKREISPGPGQYLSNSMIVTKPK